ncbi:efflux RND transporter periplasmic adaptor subunit [Comamonas sp.]|uniref:efflux RND transporter periplasmic adaptor subunit n=1 Tax=Comamonas sp. TaxID=34028 RepID=UPI0028A2CE64|nr:efflux RND transporter periplasmic adaptor subunit [Comamonas sp.]
MNFFSTAPANAWARLIRPAPIAIACALVLTACGKDNATSTPSAAQGGAPQVPVGVVTAKSGEVGLITELPGRIEASRIAQVRARSAGILQKRLFKEGSDVKAGQALFQIDAAPYEASAQSARASLARAEANLVQTTAQLERFRPLVEANAISKQDFVNAESAQKQAQAEVVAAKAAVRTADINLGYAKVTAPISGRIGQALVTEGALVGQGEATPLAVIQQIDPVYVNFTQSATDAFKLRKAMDEGQLKSAGQQAAEVHVVLDDGSEYGTAGKLLFSDLTVDANTGQVTLRAEIPNPKGLLLPGLYVRIRMEQAQATNAITVPQQAVTRTEQGDTVRVVSAEGQVSTRPVKVSMASGNRWVIQEGLKDGEQVMVDGFQKLQMLPPGTPVKAVPWTPAVASPAPAQPATAAPATSEQGAQAK